MFKTIVWATDGSDSADLALPYVKSLAAQENAAVVVVHIEEVFVGRAGGYPVHADEDELKAKIDRQVADLGASGIDAKLQKVHISGGGAAHAIAEAAAEAHADVIVAGTRGHTVLAGLFIGSVTQRLLHISPCPVLVVPAIGKVAEGAQTDAVRATA
jgi:nucleotide-binding universal stress UspA family protein